ncbi:MAG TPA: hypothetical protein PKH79_07360 [Prolixibacteraceae bacterium]|nr:hypothetical protein [Prolixibacteraceae bacterium]
MKTRFFLTLLIATCLITGCEKSENTPTSPDGKIKEIIDSTDQIIGEFSYNKNGLLTQSWMKEDFYTPGEKAEYTYTFDSEYRLTKKEGYEPGNIIMSSMTGALGKNVLYSYTYNQSGQLEKVVVEYIYPNSSDLNYKMNYLYEYPDDSRITESINNINPLANSILSSNEYLFDSKKNITKITNYYLLNGTEKRIISETALTYDSQKAPYHFNPAPSSKSNLLTKNITVYNYDEAGNQTVAYTSAYSYEYLYNDDGYPVQQTEIMPNNVKIIRKFKY